MNNETTDYQVRLPVFEGPLDLLLHLVEKREVDITAVSLASVADQYLEHLKAIEETDPESIVNFLVIAAKLLVLKSWALLPSSTLSPEQEEIVQDLTMALREYQLYKKAADKLREREHADERSFPRVAQPAILSQPVLEKVSVQDLAAALLKYLRQKNTAEDLSVPLPTRFYTVEEKVEAILGQLAGNRRLGFISTLGAATSRLEVIVTFLAVLELLRRGQIQVEQETLFAEIFLTAR